MSSTISASNGVAISATISATISASNSVAIPHPLSRDELVHEAEAQRALAELFPHLKADALRAIQDLFPLQARAPQQPRWPQWLVH